ncbi:uncharacterized protein ARMOST_10577 [Armillaria ostoyae]|uniref:Retrovirus-related Pol polyprotein from transposon TNT 1-94-like beta-barrel domain-containing protein n=1 Tax=Armillaria ostoyae TaxID=47428 RepID=A0A284RER1_ARMOS|nr:uncharacterized protein ARMOST_10577 [Armillaria ostoyae]
MVDKELGSEAVFADFKTTDCTNDFLNNENFFEWYTAAAIKPNSESTTLYLDAMKEESYTTIMVDIRTLLDSTCTSHIFKDRHLFWTYNEEKAVNVKTANCGSLKTSTHDLSITVMCTDGTKIPIRL